MTQSVNRQWLLAHGPVGTVRPNDFRYNDGPVPEPSDGEVLVRTLYFGFDGSQRIWLTDDGGYVPSVQIGGPMRTMGIRQVVASRNTAYAVGDLLEDLRRTGRAPATRSTGFGTWVAGCRVGDSIG